MSLREIAAAIGLVTLLVVLSGAGSGWDAGAAMGSGELAYPTLAGSRQQVAFALALGAATLAVLLAEHSRRSRR